MRFQFKTIQYEFQCHKLISITRDNDFFYRDECIEIIKSSSIEGENSLILLRVIANDTWNAITKVE